MSDPLTTKEQPMTNGPVLLPCPFCGGEAYYDRLGTPRVSAIVACGDCGCRMESGDTGENSGRTWNSRAAHEPGAVRHAQNQGFAEGYVKAVDDVKYLGIDSAMASANQIRHNVTSATPPPPDVQPQLGITPIARVTIRGGLAVRTGLYAPGLPDGEHDLFPVPLDPKGAMQPFMAPQPPSVWQPIETVPHMVEVVCWWTEINGAQVDTVEDTESARLYGYSHWMPLPSPPQAKGDAL